MDKQATCRIPGSGCEGVAADSPGWTASEHRRSGCSGHKGSFERRRGYRQRAVVAPRLSGIAAAAAAASLAVGAGRLRMEEEVVVVVPRRPCHYLAVARSCSCYFHSSGQ